MNELDVLPKTCVQIYGYGTYHGSGVLVKISDIFYVFSAAHVFSQNINNPISLENFHGVSEIYGKIEFGALIGSQDALMEHDIIVISVDGKHDFPGFPNIKLCEDITFPNISLIFRGTQKSPALKPHSVDRCTVDTPKNNIGMFCLKVPVDAYSDMRGNVGADVMSGYSGSGIFIKGTEDIYLVGIAQSIDKDDFPGVNCRSITVIKDSFIPNAEMSDFHGGNVHLKLNVAEIRKSITQQMIDERKINGYGDVENITMKMNAFIEGWTTLDLDDFINDILVWESIEHSRIRNNSRYRDIIDNAKATWAAGVRIYHVDTVQKGNERFHKILDELIDTLKGELKGTPIESSSRVIAAGEIAKRLADCTLKFKKCP